MSQKMPGAIGWEHLWLSPPIPPLKIFTATKAPDTSLLMKAFCLLSLSTRAKVWRLTFDVHFFIKFSQQRASWLFFFLTKFHYWLLWYWRSLLLCLISLISRIPMHLFIPYITIFGIKTIFGSRILSFLTFLLFNILLQFWSLFHKWTHSLTIPFFHLVLFNFSHLNTFFLKFFLFLFDFVLLEFWNLLEYISFFTIQTLKIRLTRPMRTLFWLHRLFFLHL